jgi:hypothetical protein
LNLCQRRNADQLVGGSAEEAAAVVMGPGVDLMNQVSVVIYEQNFVMAQYMLGKDCFRVPVILSENFV